MKNIVFLALIACLIGFSSCSEKSEDVVIKVNPLLVYGTYEGTYTNTSGTVGNLTTTTDNNYQVKIVDHGGGNSISIAGANDNNITLVTTTLSTSDGVTYTGSLEDPALNFFSFNVSTKKVKISLYQNNEQKEYEGYKQ
ncbi:hypothetical protein [Aureispira sp. CCB-E]|uniref:hypothetical protein n=1 Tax=Aureispira sp. CCB-E TaxID=3051121 RepID=UPI0028686472|nr:hypothetical protein [Aureispira sp. CCB-E]WMX15270.1 hypothetical protein QP953_02655 [Aureispira sp. CCB-E]